VFIIMQEQALAHIMMTILKTIHVVARWTTP
jgi:hypothetical protein